MADTKISLMPTLGQADVVATTDVVPVVTIGPPNVNKKVTPQALVGASVSNLTQTWNDAGTVFSAVKMNVTDSASNASSTLLDLQVGGASQFKVSKAGVTSVGSTLELGHASDTTLSRSSAGVLAVEGIVVPTVSSTNTLSNKTLASPTITGTISGTPTWGSPQQFSTIELGSGTDTTLSRASAGILAVEGVAVPTISSSDTLSNKTLSSPTINGTVTLSGSPTFSGTITAQAGGTTSGTFALGTAANAVISASSGATLSINSAGYTTVNISGTNLQFNSVAIPTISSTDTLSNKTLSSPVLSGTVTGSPTFSGGVTFSRGTNHEVVVFNQTNPATYNLDVQWQDNGAVRWLQSVRTNSNDDFWTYNIARASADISISAASGVVAMANGATGQSGAAIPTISSTDTLSNKTLSSPTVSGTVAGSATWSGAQTFGVGGASGTATYLYINGTAAGTGGGSALWINNNGTIKGGIGSWSAFTGGTYDSDLTLYSPTSTYYCYEAGIKRQFATDANVMTLSNKTLSSPTVSGTIAGGATWTGAQVFSNATTILGNTSAGAFGAKVYVTSGASTQTTLALYNPGIGLSHIGYDATDSRLRLYNCYADGILANGFGLEIATTGVLSVKTSGGTAVVPTISSTDTLSNKTLSSPTLSGTVAGSPTFSGTTTFQNYNLVIQTTSATGTSGLRFRQSDGVQRWDWGFNDNDDSIFLNRFNSSGSYQDTPIAVDNTGAVNFKGVAVPTISSTDTLSNKTLSSPTLSGTVAGASTFSGNTIFSGGLNSSSSTGLNLTYASGAQGSSLSLARPATSTSLAGNVVIDVNGNNLRIYEVGGSFRGINVDFTTMGSQSALATLDTAQTLSNKTLSSPTLSGTVAGNNITFTGPAIKIGDGTDTVAMTGTSPLLRIQGASFSTGVTVRRDGNAEVGIQSAGTGNIGTWTAHNVQFMRNGSAMGGFDASAIFIGQVNNPRFYLYNNAGTASTLTLGADSADTFLGSFTNAPFGIYTNSTKRINIPAAGGFELIDGNNILIGTTTGTKIGTSTSQKLGFFNATPIVQPTAVADATDAASVITQLNALLTRMRNLGLIAT